MKTVKNAWVFDVDGVITNIEQEKITEPHILEFIIRTLKKCEPVALNTGRGIGWVERTVLNPLKAKASNQELLQNLFVAAESGGVKATFNQDGSLNLQIDESLKMSYDLDQKVQKLVKEKYSKSMRYEDKKTMITTKIKEGTPLEKFHKEQQEIAKDLQILIDSYGLTDKFKVDISTIGTNIMDKTTGKDRGIELILEWLSVRKIKPQKFITFGDSLSDFPMAEKAHEQGFQTEFIYVGGDNAFENIKTEITIKITKNKFEKGALEFLKTL